MKRSRTFAAPAPGTAPEDGFSIIELLVVIVIISILAAIAIPVFFNQRDKALRSQVVSGLRNGATIMQAWGTENDGDYDVPQGEGASAVQDMEWMEGDGWPPTEGVLIDIVEADADGFCLHGSHSTLSSIHLELDSNVGDPVEGDCS